MIFTILYLSVCAVAGNVEFDALIFITTGLLDVVTTFLSMISKDMKQ